MSDLDDMRECAVTLFLSLVWFLLGVATTLTYIYLGGWRG